MDSLGFICIYCGATAISMFATALCGVLAARVWEAEDEEEHFLLRCSATNIAWIVSCIINAGFIAYYLTTWE
jgi:hypothetical protein